MAERVCGWCKGAGKLTGGRATYDCTICRDPNERKPMYDQQPKSPDPLKLAVALTSGSPTAEECHLAGQWIAEATRSKPAPVALTAEMLGEENREHLRVARSWLTDFDAVGIERCEADNEAAAFLDRLLNQGEG